jgi:hypothetical protein
MAHPECATVFFMSDSCPRALFVSIPAAAKLMGIGLKRMKAAVDAGQMPAVEIGDRKLIPRRAIERLAQVEAEA